MTQKVLKVGTSAAVTIPKKSLKELGLKIGGHVFVYIDSANQRVIISRRPVRDFGFMSQRDAEVIQWTRRFITRYRKDLEAFAKK